MATWKPDGTDRRRPQNQETIVSDVAQNPTPLPAAPSGESRSPGADSSNQVGKDASGRVSICIPIFNGARYLREALTSAALQTYQEIEILVSDDGSTDGSSEIIDDFGKTYSGQVRVLHHDRLGMVSNWNHLLAASTGEYVKYLFQDDRFEPNCVQEMVQLAQRDPKMGFVFSQRELLYGEEDSRDPSIGRAIRTCGNLHKAWTVLKEVQDGVELLRDPNLFRAPFNKIGEPTTVLVRRSALVKLNGFDTSLKHLVDVDMWLRLLCWYRVGFVNKPLSHFRLHPDQQTWKNSRDGAEAQDIRHLNEKVRCDPHYAPLREALARKQGQQLRV
jgi:glycosyltransferase involved in cell wall biosynthesis